MDDVNAEVSSSSIESTSSGWLDSGEALVELWNHVYKIEFETNVEADHEEKN